MKVLFTGLLLLLGLSVYTNEDSVRSLNGENKLFIITLDGFRWQEVFRGADPLLLHNPAFTPGRALELYGAASAAERRQKLLPFFWTTMASRGELYGNRDYGNKMNVANPYALSYPGYNELLTGHVDLSVFDNGEVYNANVSLLEFLNASAAYQNKVAAFASWDAFRYILNEKQSRLFLNCGFENLPVPSLKAAQFFIHSLQQQVEDRKTTRYDELTYIACREYIRQHRPSIVFLSFGGTDEAAHQKRYDRYLQQAHQADRMIGELWQYLQTLPEYAGKTTFLITTDHGRGQAADNWFTHGAFTSGSSQTWMGWLGPSIPRNGERKNSMQFYQKNLRELMLKILAQ